MEQAIGLGEFSLIDKLAADNARSLGLGEGYDYTIGRDKHGKFAAVSPADIISDKVARENGIQSGHWTDAGKLPWHQTFSNESYYSGSNKKGLGSIGSIEGGQWGTAYNQDGVKVDSYTPSQAQINNGLIDEEILRDYFARNEAGNKLLNPAPYQTLNKVPVSFADKKAMTGY